MSPRARGAWKALKGIRGMIEEAPPLRGLVVGVGSLGRVMLERLADRSGFQCVGIVDVTETGREQGRVMTGLAETALFDNLDRALAAVRPDVVLINTPSELHHDQARICIDAGCHLLVAKPITNDFADAVDLVKRAEERGVTLCVGQQIRYMRHFTALAEYVASGALGSAEAAWFMNSKPRPEVRNLGKMLQPSLYENTCHHFDAFLSVFQEQDPLWICCDGFVPSWSKYAGPCMVNAMMRFDGGLHLSYHGGFSSQAPMMEFRIEGSQGALRCRGLHMSNETIAYESAPALGDFSPCQIDGHVPPRNPWGPLLDAWIAYIRGGPEPPFSGRRNLKVFAMLSAAIASVETGNPVAIAENPKYSAAFSGDGS